MNSKYKGIYIDGKWMPEHRYIMEQYLGRTLNKNEVVHHINHIKDDNRIENLQVMNKIDHIKLHAEEWRIKFKKQDSQKIIKPYKKQIYTSFYISFESIDEKQKLDEALSKAGYKSRTEWLNEKYRELVKNNQ